MITKTTLRAIAVVILVLMTGYLLKPDWISIYWRGQTVPDDVISIESTTSIKSVKIKFVGLINFVVRDWRSPVVGCAGTHKNYCISVSNGGSVNDELVIDVHHSYVTKDIHKLYDRLFPDFHVSLCGGDNWNMCEEPEDLT